MEIATLTIGALLFVSLFFSWVFNVFKIPDVLPLFLIGLVIGPILGLVDSSNFESIGQIFATITLSIILFEGGLHMKLGSLLRSARNAVILIITQLVATVALVSVLGHYIFDISYPMGVAIGTILAGTSATIIVPLIRKLDIKESTKDLLKIESSLNNIVTIVVVFGAIAALGSGSLEFSEIGSNLVGALLYSTLLGLASGFFWSQVFVKLRGIQNSLFTTPAFLLVLFAAAELIGTNGAMTVLVFGITLGNLQDLKLSSFRFFRNLKDFHLTDKEETFFSSLVFIVKTYFFVFIGMSINLVNINYIIWGAVIAAALYVLRILIVNMYFKGQMPTFDLFVTKIMIPKGLTEAALLTFVGNQFLNNVSYPVIMFSIIFTSLLTFYGKYRYQKKDIEPPATEYSFTHPAQESFHQLP